MVTALLEYIDLYNLLHPIVTIQASDYQHKFCCLMFLVTNGKNERGFSTSTILLAEAVAPFTHLLHHTRGPWLHAPVTADVHVRKEHAN